MSEIAQRWRTVADGFGARVDAVPDGGWERPTPCEGWVARDVVAHLVEWIPPALFETLDAGEVERLTGFPPEVEQAMRASGHFGARVDVPDDASAQDRVLAFFGRTP